MPSKSRTHGKLTTRYKKQHGLHHKHSNKYLKVYTPYLPVLLLVIAGIVTSFVILYNKHVGTSGNNISQNTLLQNINDVRSAYNEGSVALNPKLTQAAQAKAEDMASKNYWSHTSPSGKSPWDYIQSTGYQFVNAGENLAYGFDNSDAVVNSWANTSDKINLLNSNYNDVGIGIVHDSNFQGKGPETIIVALFATPYGKVFNAINTKVPNINTSTPFSNVSVAGPNSQSVAKLETYTIGNASWAMFVTGLIGGVALAVVLIRHGILIRKWATEGEKLIIHHPVIDICLVIVLLSTAYLQQTAGFIH